MKWLAFRPYDLVLGEVEANDMPSARRKAEAKWGRRSIERVQSVASWEVARREPSPLDGDDQC